MIKITETNLNGNTLKIGREVYVFGTNLSSRTGRGIITHKYGKSCHRIDGIPQFVLTCEIVFEDGLGQTIPETDFFETGA